MLTVPEITQDEAKQLETELDKLVTGVKGSVLSFEKWGKYKLTYPISGNEYGVYFLIRFETPETLTTQIDELFKIKLNNFVMRYVVSRVEGNSLEYQRPKSLEEAPASRDMDAFLKENKMEGLLSSVDEKKKAEARKEEVAAPVEEKTEEAAAPAEQ